MTYNVALRNCIATIALEAYLQLGLADNYYLMEAVLATTNNAKCNPSRPSATNTTVRQSAQHTTCEIVLDV